MAKMTQGSCLCRIQKLNKSCRRDKSGSSVPSLVKITHHHSTNPVAGPQAGYRHYSRAHRTGNQLLPTAWQMIPEKYGLWEPRIWEVWEVFLEALTLGREGAFSKVRMAGARTPCRHESHVTFERHQEVESSRCHRGGARGLDLGLYYRPGEPLKRLSWREALRRWVRAWLFKIILFKILNRFKVQKAWKIGSEKTPSTRSRCPGPLLKVSHSPEFPKSPSRDMLLYAYIN